MATFYVVKDPSGAIPYNGIATRLQDARELVKVWLSEDDCPTDRLLVHVVTNPGQPMRALLGSDANRAFDWAKRIGILAPKELWVREAGELVRQEVAK